jgi:hypothetical protein
VPDRAPFLRPLMWTGLLCGGALAVAGGLALRGPELVAVGVAGVLAASMAAGIAREAPDGHRRSTLEAAAAAAGVTVVALLVVAGIAALAGGGVAAVALVVAVLATLAVRAVTRRRRAARLAPPAAPPTAPPLVLHRSAADRRPVSAMSTPELGQEWLRSTAVLAGRLDPAARQALVGRRQETLDELERRDPPGFGRWLAAGLAADPADYVRRGPLPGRPLQGDPAADTDAA